VALFLEEAGWQKWQTKVGTIWDEPALAAAAGPPRAAATAAALFRAAAARARWRQRRMPALARARSLLVPC